MHSFNESHTEEPFSSAAFIVKKCFISHFIFLYSVFFLIPMFCNEILSQISKARVATGHTWVINQRAKPLNVTRDSPKNCTL